MSKFRSYVTSVGFRLELSRAQLRAFSAVALASKTRLPIYGADSQTSRSLYHKGLITFNDEGDPALTPEGELLAPLLRRAGLLEADIIKRGKLPTFKETEND